MTQTEYQVRLIKYILKWVSAWYAYCWWFDRGHSTLIWTCIPPCNRHTSCIGNVLVISLCRSDSRPSSSKQSSENCPADANIITIFSQFHRPTVTDKTFPRLLVEGKGVAHCFHHPFYTIQWWIQAPLNFGQLRVSPSPSPPPILY